MNKTRGKSRRARLLGDKLAIVQRKREIVLATRRMKRAQQLSIQINLVVHGSQSGDKLSAFESIPARQRFP
jgi:hypothetical protein